MDERVLGLQAIRAARKASIKSGSFEPIAGFEPLAGWKLLTHKIEVDDGIKWRYQVIGPKSYPCEVCSLEFLERILDFVLGRSDQDNAYLKVLAGHITPEELKRQRYGY